MPVLVLPTDSPTLSQISRTTANLGTTYHVNPKQFAQHPIYSDVLAANPVLFPFSSTNEVGSTSHKNDLLRHILKPVQIPAPAKAEETKAPTLRVPTSLSRFERKVENAWLQRLQSYCQSEVSCGFFHGASKVDC